MIVVNVVIDKGNQMAVQGMIKSQMQHNGMNLVSRPILLACKDMASVIAMVNRELAEFDSLSKAKTKKELLSLLMPKTYSVVKEGECKA